MRIIMCFFLTLLLPLLACSQNILHEKFGEWTEKEGLTIFIIETDSGSVFLETSPTYIEAETIASFYLQDYKTVVKNSDEVIARHENEYYRCYECSEIISFLYAIKGISLNRLNKYEESVFALTKSIKYKANNSDYYTLANISDNKNDTLAVVPYAAYMHPNINDVYFYRSMSKEALGDLSGAKRDIESVIDNSSSDSKYFRLYGFILYRQSLFVEAISIFNKALLDFPDDPMLYYFRALSKGEIGEIESACEDLSRVGELGYSAAYEMIRSNCN